MKYQGRLFGWNDDKGYGFVEPNGGGQRSFVHIKAFQSRSRRPVNGDILIYEPQKQPDGRYQATNIRYTSTARKAAKKEATSHRGSSLPALFFCVFLVAAYLSEQLSLYILLIYMVLSLITYIAYAWDKDAARKEQHRTKESTLHMLALAGGWPGALYARQSLRHKSSKAEFIKTFWGSVVINVVALLFFTSDGATAWLLTLLS